MALRCGLSIKMGICEVTFFVHGKAEDHVHLIASK